MNLILSMLMCTCGYMNDEYIVPMCPHTKKHLPPPMCSTALPHSPEEKELTEGDPDSPESSS